MIDQETKKLLDSMNKKIDDQAREILALQNRLRDARVIIKNFEGAFKILDAAPTTTDTQEGCIYLTNVAGVYGLYARINNGWRAVALT